MIGPRRSNWLPTALISPRWTLAVLCGLAFVTPCVADDAAAVPPATDAAAIICSGVASQTEKRFDEQDREAVSAFYAARECRPYWVDEQGPTRAARLAMDEIGHAAEWGLNAADFRMEAARRPIDGRWSAEQAAAAELDITAAVLRYAHQAQGGRIPTPDKQLSSYLDRQPSVTSAGDVLAQISQSSDPGALLRSYQPSQDQFMKLKALLATLRGGEPVVPDVIELPRRGPMLQLGVAHADVALLRKRLGVAAEAGKEQVFDQPLFNAVKAFQQSASLQADGVVGPMTRAALGGDTAGQPDTSAKITAIIANMEEWRWMPRSLGDTHIFVNVPSFSIVVTDKGRTVFDDRVIVGTPNTQTPIFSKDMTTVVLRPQWNLPDSIKLTALLSGRPLERQGYVIKRNGRVVSSAKINWSKASLSQYEIYQPSGDDNALGLVKLLFPNKHSVYLHDTPSKSLFNDPVRLFSHGCMRVRNPQDLAQDILDIDRGDQAPDVKQLIRKGPMSNEFALATPIPVHVGYFTVWIGDDGNPQFYKDYYGHQQRITLALAGKWDQIEVGEDHLAAVDTSALSRIKFADDKPEDTPVASYKYDGGVGDVIRKSLGF